MALVQVRSLFRCGLVEKVSRFVSPPNPSGQTSFLWKSDSFSMQKRALMLARLREFKTTLFSSTAVAVSSQAGTAAAEIHTSPTLEAEVAAAEEDGKSSVTSSGTSSIETDSGLLDRSYGEEQAHHLKVAESSHDHHLNTKDDEASETLEQTGFDISKISRPSGDE